MSCLQAWEPVIGSGLPWVYEVLGPLGLQVGHGQEAQGQCPEKITGVRSWQQSTQKLTGVNGMQGDAVSTIWGESQLSGTKGDEGGVEERRQGKGKNGHE